MLIGINGKIGSGKDTVGKIIQYLVWKSKVERGELPLSVYSFSDFARETSFGKNQSNFEIKKYADKLKDFVCMLIGCTREQLEDQDFKNKELPEEWWVYKVESFNDDESYDIIGSYEDRYELLDDHNFDVEEHNKLYGDLDPKMTEEEFNKEFLIKTTPRLLLQIIGTEYIRDKVHPNAWVNALFSDYRDKVDFDNNLPKSSSWIITDMRFPNELEAVKSRGGITIRVDRFTSIKNDLVYFKNDASDSPINGIYRVLEVKKDNCTLIDDKTGYSFGAWFEEISKTHEHESETALDNAEFDYIIENNSSIEDLIHTVSLILKREKII